MAKPVKRKAKKASRKIKVKSAVKAKKKAKAVKHANVVIFTSPTCTYCRLAKQFLDKHSIQYIEKDVSKNHNTAQELMNKSGQMGVPVVIIGDITIVGYDEAAMKKALKIK